MSRKDSKGMFAAVLGKLDEEKSKEQPTPRSSSPHLMKVAAGVRQMQERSEMAERLLHQGEVIVELDPSAIMPSSIMDRFDAAYDAEAIAEIAQSIQERGQIVPGLVRPVPGRPDQFQIVYGRRRLAAAKQLGLKFKAAMRELSDEEAVIIQGEENTAREDLSFIEKCLFAVAQADAGYKRETICSSLSTGKSHVSEMIKIGSLVDRPVLFAIGKAPGIGRGRWEEFSRRWQLSDTFSSVEELINRPAFRAANSDDRFIQVFEQISAETQKASKKVSTSSSNAFPVRQWIADDQAVDASLKRTEKKAVLSLSATDGPRFAEFLVEHLDELYEQFKRSDKS
ncbi:plasmid partitioning protein RepB [Brucella rhizosphaerae]|nr:plasmid partitioning protein RepB [Brucella rhizosphaerae]